MAPQAPIGQSSAKPRPTPTTAEQFILSGPSDLPDPTTSAYRNDLADVALAGRVIASHYAEPLARTIVATTPLLQAPSSDAESLGELAAGEPFELLDDSLGWAWGYGGTARRVGYVPSSGLTAQ
jgi:hypothetical protein